MAFRTDIDALILAVLHNNKLHGYEITKQINAHGEKSFQVKEGQLYPILHRLENEGKIAADWIPQEGKPARKVYHLTDSGLRELDRQRATWRAFADSVDKALHPRTEVQHG